MQPCMCADEFGSWRAIGAEVERVAIWDYVLPDYDFLNPGPSLCCELFHKIYAGSYVYEARTTRNALPN